MLMSQMFGGNVNNNWAYRYSRMLSFITCALQADKELRF
jgi:hypothetical protein